MSTTTKLNNDLNAGQDWVTTLNILIADGTANRDITGCTLVSQIRRHWKSVSSKTSVGIIVLDATTGSIRMTLTAAQTTLLKSGKYVYDVEMTTPPTLTVKDATGTFITDEVITGATSGATGTVIAHSPLTKITYNITSGTFAGTETINGTTYNTTLVSNDGRPIERAIEGVFTVQPEVTV